jgi:uncharacterized oxidoreductase
MSTKFLNLANANVLITGGSEGIGRGLAERFLKAGSAVLVTGRNPGKLMRAAADLPGLQTFANDIGQPEERIRLAEHIPSVLPGLNVLINNAGIQRRISLASDAAPWPERQAEIDMLFAGPVHLNSLLIPVMLKNGPGSIVNVTSGGGFIPQVFAPIYSASKAALHSYTVTLRHALAPTSLRVVELIPPAIQTKLAGPGATHGAPLDAFCDHAFAALQTEALTVGFGATDSPEFRQMLRFVEPMFEASANRFPVTTYATASPRALPGDG